LKRRNYTSRCSSQHAGDCNSPWRNSANADLDAILALDSSSVTERETEMAISDSNTSNSRKSGENVRSKRCKEKNCDFVTYDNNEYWTHKATTHRDVYSYVCPYGHCKFLTKYKHHMNHHQLSKHENVKRFECNYKGCTYRCVTKSMLVSHQKSHWDYYPYQCGTCTYKSKFLNIYKKHLRDNNHQHGIALNRYGIPDPTIVIDIYGTRRGPRQTATATSNHGRDRGLSERLQPMSDNKSAYSIILEAFQSFNLDSSIIEFELLRSQMSKDLPEIHDANSNFGQLQRPSAIDVNREKSMSANIEAFVQDMSAARLVASVIAIKNMSAAGAPLMLPQPQESETTDAPLDLRVSEAARRKDQS